MARVPEGWTWEDLTAAAKRTLLDFPGRALLCEDGIRSGDGAFGPAPGKTNTYSESTDWYAKDDMIKPTPVDSASQFVKNSEIAYAKRISLAEETKIANSGLYQGAA